MLHYENHRSFHKIVAGCNEKSHEDKTKYESIIWLSSMQDWNSPRIFEYHQPADDNLIFDCIRRFAPRFEIERMPVCMCEQEKYCAGHKMQAPRRFLFGRDKYSINQMYKYHKHTLHYLFFFGAFFPLTFLLHREYWMRAMLLRCFVRIHFSSVDFLVLKV